MLQVFPGRVSDAFEGRRSDDNSRLYPPAAVH